MKDVVLNIVGAGKRYAAWSSNIKRILSWFSPSIRPDGEFWAVRDISFSLRRGEALALIGQNGAGKSTLLKMVTGIIRPTTGSIQVGGRISAIIELGLGFNPEFTARQNVYEAGGMMGLSRAEIDAVIDEISEFSELGSFFDEPLRIFSSGMQARLAFSLATAIRPDILIVDEVLAVGDIYFQHKSFNRIKKFKEEGSAILFVTHTMGDVRSLCDRCVLLDHGKVLKSGAPDEVVDFYNAMIAEKEVGTVPIAQERHDDGWLVTRSGTFEVKTLKLELLNAENKAPTQTLDVGQKALLRLVAKAEKAIPRLIVGFMIRDKMGHIIWGSNTEYSDQPTLDIAIGETITFEFEFTCTLGPGSYSFSTSLSSSETHLENNFEWQDNILVFNVVNLKHPFFIGSSFLDSSFSINRELNS